MWREKSTRTKPWDSYIKRWGTRGRTSKDTAYWRMACFLQPIISSRDRRHMLGSNPFFLFEFLYSYALFYMQTGCYTFTISRYSSCRLRFAPHLPFPPVWALWCAFAEAEADTVGGGAVQFTGTHPAERQVEQSSLQVHYPSIPSGGSLAVCSCIYFTSDSLGTIFCLFEDFWYISWLLHQSVIS